MKKLKKYLPQIKITFIVILFIFFLIGLTLTSIVILNQKGEFTFTNQIPKEGTIFKKYAYIAGEVKNPGVYEIVDGMRIVELIKMADGYTENADLEYIAKDLNLASILKDEQKVFIPSKVKVTSVKSESTSIQNEEAKSDGKINLNSCTLEDLDELPGVGPATAQKIIENRPYSKINDLLEVPGIGDSKFTDIKPHVIL